MRAGYASHDPHQSAVCQICGLADKVSGILIADPMQQVSYRALPSSHK